MNSQTEPQTWRRLLPWLNIALTILLIVAGVWYLSTRVELVEVGRVLVHARPGPVFVALAVMLLTIGLKSWRWQLLFATDPPVRLSPVFWALALGQYVNLIVPFLRLGEVARLYALNQETGVAPARVLGTLVVEKTLDIIFFGLTIAFILPLVILPDYLGAQGPFLLLLPAAFLAVLYLLAYQTAMVTRLWRRIVRPLPDRLEQWFLRIAVSGLEGLAALRDRRLNLLLLGASALIAALSVLLPYTLFYALDLPLTLLDAALVHVVVSAAIAPPSTPAKIGVFNGAAALMLYQFGIRDEAAIASYAILLYLVVIVPQIALGLVAASRSKWRWRASTVANIPSPESQTV